MSATQRVVRLNPADAIGFFTQLADEFVASPAYLRIEGRPVVSILNLPDFSAAYSLDGVRFLLKLLRHRVQERLGLNPYIIGLLPDGRDASVYICRNLPCDAITGYGLLPDWMGPPVQSYEELIQQRTAEWYRIQGNLDVPFIPVVCVGWDASRRGAPVNDLRQVSGFPWRPIITGVTPQLFGKFLDKAIEFIREHDQCEDVVFIHAWNEWSEGSAVEASVELGTSYLEEISARFGPGTPSVVTT